MHSNSVEYLSCGFPYCPNCSNCNNPTGLCPSSPSLFCSRLASHDFIVEAVSCDNGVTWLDFDTDLGIQSNFDVSHSTTSLCSDS